HVVAPLSFRIKAEGNYGQEIATGGCVCKIKDVLCRKQAGVGIDLGARISVIRVEAERESRSHPARQVRADRRSGSHSSRGGYRSVYEHRTMTNVPVIGTASLVRVVNLRKAPDIMIAYRFGIPISNSDLIIEGLAVVVPHVEQPVGAELRFGGEIRSS